MIGHLVAMIEPRKRVLLDLSFGGFLGMGTSLLRCHGRVDLQNRFEPTSSTSTTTSFTRAPSFRADKDSTGAIGSQETELHRYYGTRLIGAASDRIASGREAVMRQANLPCA